MFVSSTTIFLLQNVCDDLADSLQSDQPHSCYGDTIEKLQCGLGIANDCCTNWIVIGNHNTNIHHLLDLDENQPAGLNMKSVVGIS